MNLENQVVSLELAKKLKELGVKQESLFWWIGDHVYFSKRVDEFTLSAADCAAFTVAEFGKLLPFEIEAYGGLGFLHSSIGKNWAQTYYTRGDTTYLINAIDMPTEADSRAKMLIYLLENGLITRAIDKEV